MRLPRRPGPETQATEPAEMIKGRLTRFDNGCLQGWAIDTDRPGTRLTIELLHQGQVLGTAVANQMVRQLHSRGIGDGRYGFAVALPGGLMDGQRHRFSARDQQTQSIFQTDFEIELPSWSIGRIEGICAGTVFGWVPDLGGQMALDVWINGERVAGGAPQRQRRNARIHGHTQPVRGFVFDLPEAFEKVWMQGSVPELSIAHQATGLRVTGAPMLVAPDHAWGVMEKLDSEAATGWVCRADGQPARVELWIDGQQLADTAPTHWRTDLCRIGVLQPRCGFRLPIPEHLRDNQEHLVELRPAGQADLLRRGRVRIQLTLAEELSAAEELPLPAPPKPQARTAPDDGVVDIIIPVYRGLEETLACLRSVLECGDATPHHIVIVNDASPEPELTTALRALARQHPQQIELIENEQNKGFVGSINRGTRLHPGRDVILLNSDTLVPRSDWIARLLRAGRSSGNVATATPLSNRATIFSLPRCNFNNDLMPGQTVDSTDAFCRELNTGEVVDVPTAVGFCMYIRRRALNTTGDFNEQVWARGYCEENDFCLRATDLGWRHVAACDVFVQHHGEVSFAGEREALMRRNAPLLDRLHPHYKPSIRRFLETDPLWRARARIVLPLLRAQVQTPILHIMHTWGGGTERHVLDLCDRLAWEGQHSLMLRARPNGWMELSDPAARWPLSMPRGTPMTECADLLRALGIRLVHIHHTMGLPPAIWELPARLGVPFDVTLHDHFFACPRVNLLDDQGQFCDQPPLERCEVCVQATELPPHVEPAFSEIGGTAQTWRVHHHRALKLARRIVAPCADTARRFQAAFPDLQASVRAHPEDPVEFLTPRFPGEGEALRVAVIGAIGPHKGHRLLLDTARHVRDRQAPIRLIIVGPTCDDDAYFEYPQVDIIGRYRHEELPGLLQRLRCHVALFLSNWPETYSYTLTEAWRAGLWPVVTGLGALAERVQATGMGTVLSAIPTADQVFEGLLCARVAKTARHGTWPTNAKRTLPESLLADYYELPAA